MELPSLQARKGVGSWAMKYHSWQTTHVYHQIHRRQISHLFIRPCSNKSFRSLANRIRGIRIGAGCTSSGRAMSKIVTTMLVRDGKSTEVERLVSWRCLQTTLYG